MAKAVLFFCMKTEEDILVMEPELNKVIIVYNDDVNDFQHVIECFIKYCKHDLIQAEQCAYIIHERGKYAVKEGTYDELLPIKQALCENGLTAKIN